MISERAVIGETTLSDDEGSIKRCVGDTNDSSVCARVFCICVKFVSARLTICVNEVGVIRW